MAARGYLLLLTCILAHLPLELARLPEGRILHEDNTHRQHSQISMVGHRSEPPPRLHGGHPRKVPSFLEAEQQKNKPLPFRRRQRSSRKLFPAGEDLEVVEDTMTEHKEYYLPTPPPRMNSHVYQDLVHYGEEEMIRNGPREVTIPEPSFGVTPHIYQDPVFQNEWDINHGRRQNMIRMPHYESLEQKFTDLEDEKLRQAHKHHNSREQEHRREHKHKHELERGPIIERNNYWILGQRRFRMIVIIILAVIVCLIILLMLVWFIHPRKNVRKTRSKN
ncbi:uncharacterized protein LOC121271401 isoform X2 [Carcharodon carcharias]|uniref:uncharacterized protein LOC121271401 isoform X2 n=1 Tax=Carcharodon carcharias TaxID=13397 RepID=UPI001B7F17F5|nr:uncharacterized protein LOC121271401 isoform X2 [Carcharodon carcharias]